MYREIEIDLDKLKEDLLEKCRGAYFGGGFGGALIESYDIERATPEKLIQIAKKKGFDLTKYQV